MQEITVKTDLVREGWTAEDVGPNTGLGDITHIGLWPEGEAGPSYVEVVVNVDVGENQPPLTILGNVSLSLYLKAGTAMMTALAERGRS